VQGTRSYSARRRNRIHSSRPAARVGRGSVRAAARDVTKGQRIVTSHGSGGASPYRAGREIERSKIEDKEDDEQD
jgi:hypothetical protein